MEYNISQLRKLILRIDSESYYSKDIIEAFQKFFFDKANTEEQQPCKHT